MTELSARVIREDHRLDAATAQTREELARHRWHWTLDESNAKRVPLREYARQVGCGYTTVHDMVTGYNDWSDRGAPISELADYMERAKLRGDKRAATEAVADAKKVSIGTARRHHAEEVRQVEAAARERVERSAEPIKIEEAARTIAAGRVKGAEARKRVADERRKRHTARYMRIEGFIASARRQVLSALTEAQDVAFTDDERELLSAAAEELRSILQLIDLRIAGDANIDWDAELAKLAEQ